MYKMAKRTNTICESCAMWKMHGEKCWYHWNEKQVCSQKLEMDMPDEKEDKVSKVLDE